MDRKWSMLVFKHVTALMASLLVCVAMLTACGDNTNTPSGAANTTAASGTTAAANTTAAGNATTAAASTTAAGNATTAAGNATTAAGNATTAANGTGQASTVKLNTSVSGNIEFWHIWASPIRRNAIKRVIAICQNQLPNIKVKDVYKPFGDIWTANTAAVAAGSGMPDVILEDRPKLPAAAANNIEQNLQKYAARDGVDGSVFWPNVWQQTLYNGETYGIPYETDVRVMFYDKNAFKEAGLDPEKPPKTWTEVQQYADKLDKKNSDGTYSRYGFMPLINGGWDLWSYNNGASLVKDGKVNVADPKVVDTMNWIKKWVDRYGGYSAVQKFQGTFQSPPQDAFMSGKVAMYVDINGYASGLNFYRPQYVNKDGKKENMDWGVSDVPHADDAQQASISGGFALSIPRGAKNPDAAWEFIKCATGPEAQLSWARDTYSMPVRPAVANDPQLTADPNWQFMVNAMKYIVPPNFVKEYPNWAEQVDKRTADIYQGKTDAKTALDQAQQAINDTVSKNKK
ncbi:MAG TPA: ABC transporter substrate-binding protein [Chloroflexia bacterium]|nr:ABC transporter substrate-binding protein [Chloroflexia bacterium]